MLVQVLTVTGYTVMQLETLQIAAFAKNLQSKTQTIATRWNETAQEDANTQYLVLFPSRCFSCPAIFGVLSYNRRTFSCKATIGATEKMVYRWKALDLYAFSQTSRNEKKQGGLVERQREGV